MVQYKKLELIQVTQVLQVVTDIHTQTTEHKVGSVRVQVQV